MTTVGLARDEELVRALHAEHGAALWNYATGLLRGDRARAQDVVQETLLRAWRHPTALAAASSQRSWLFTVARRIVIDQWRSSLHHPEAITDHVPEQAVDDPAEQTVDRHLVVSALRTLSPDHREVLVETYLRGRSVSEAAEHLGVAEGTVKSRTHYALHALRAALVEMGADQ